MFEFLTKRLAKHLRHPEGLIGNLVLSKLNKVNATVIEETVKLLKVKPNDQFLDIGFGGGLSFQILSRQQPLCKMTGLELSESAVAKVTTQLKQHIKKQQLILKQGTVENLPFDNRGFDHIISINTVYFWEDMQTAINEIKRVLKPGGTFVLSLREKATLKKFKPTKYGFHHYERSDIIPKLEKAGFKVQIHEKNDEHPFICLESTY